MQIIKLRMPVKVAVLCMSFLFFCGDAFPLSMVPVNLAQIVQYTEQAFVGTVLSSTTIQTPEGWGDQVVMRVTEPVLGAARAGEQVQWVQARSSEQAALPGMPQLQVGASHLIFLSAKVNGSPFQAPYALGQGTFAISQDEKTGESKARNDFMNQNLFVGLDTTAIAKAVVEADAASKGLGTAEKALRASQVHSNLQPGKSGSTSLAALKSAARTLKAQPGLGATGHI